MEEQKEAQKEAQKDDKEEKNTVKGVTVDFDNARETFTVELPSFEGSEVELYKTLEFGQSGQIQKYQEKGEFEGGVMALQFLIRDWNLYDKDGDKLPIEKEVIERLPSKDVSFLVRKVEGFLKEEQNIDEKLYKK